MTKTSGFISKRVGEIWGIAIVLTLFEGSSDKNETLFLKVLSSVFVKFSICFEFSEIKEIKELTHVIKIKNPEIFDFQRKIDIERFDGIRGVDGIKTRKQD